MRVKLIGLGALLFAACGTGAEPKSKIASKSAALDGEPPYWVQTCGPPVCTVGTNESDGPVCPTPGDPCDTIGDTCGDMTACGGYVRCAEAGTPVYPRTCPISSRRFKDGVSYLSDSELAEVAQELQAIRLASYEYKQQKGNKHLGFIIEDNPASRAVVPERDMVDLYGYTSMVVASMQVQAKELQALKAELAALKAQVRSSQKKGCVK